MILQKFCETTRHTMTGSVLIYHVFSLTLKIGHLASTNKMFLKLARTHRETQIFNVGLTTFLNFCLLEGILSRIKPWKLIANFHPFTLCIACLYRIIYASDHHYHLGLTWNQSPSTLFFPESITPWMILMWCWWQLIRINIHQHQKRVHLMLCQFDNYSNGVFWIMRKWNNE